MYISYTRPYEIWRGMKKRCDVKKSIGYDRYGGRGINYDKKWKSFDCFWKDMKNGYRNNLTLDRIDNNKGYSKKNCRWATNIEQQNNMISNKHITYKGETLTLATWARKIKISQQCLYARRIQGWSIEKILTTPKLLK